MWLLVALIGNALLAIVGVMDKYILSKSVVKPIIFVFYSSIIVLPFFLLLPFGIKMPAVQTDYLIFAVSGFCFVLGLWTMYIGIQKSEISHIGPLIGAAAPFFILFFSRIFLGENLTPYHLLAATILIIGSLVISFDQSAQQLASKGPLRGWRRGLEWGVVAGLFFAVSHVAAKYAYDAYGFYNGFVLTKLPIGIFGLALIINPSIRAIFSKKEQTITEKAASKKRLVLIAVDLAFGVMGSVLLQYAMAIGSVSLVNALAGVQYAILIVVVALMSKFFPKIIKESFTKKEIIQKAIAVFIISVGLFLLLFK